MAPDPPQGPVLDSWKSIAAYFGVSARTAQIWEQTRGMPVHRLPGPRGKVYANAEELEAWSKQAENLSLAQHPAQTRPRGRLLWQAAAALAVVAAIAAGLLWWRSGRGAPSEIRISGQHVVALDVKGNLLWQYDLGSPMTEEPGYGLKGRPQVSPQLVDLDGDGAKEVLVCHLKPSASPASDDLLLLSAGGSLLWRHTVGRTAQTAAESFPPPYCVTATGAVRLGPGQPLAIAVAAIHRMYYPTQVLLLSHTGKVLREYWHSGHFKSLVTIASSQSGKETLVLGGISNAYRTATIVALDPAAMSGASQEEILDYQLLGFGPPREVARLLFPRSRFAEGTSKYSGVAQIRVVDGGFIVSVHDAIDHDSSGPTLVFHLDGQFHPTAVTLADNFYQRYRALGRDSVLTQADLDQLMLVRNLARPSPMQQ